MYEDLLCKEFWIFAKYDKKIDIATLIIVIEFLLFYKNIEIW